MSPSAAIVRLWIRMWPIELPYPIRGQPQLSASREVTPPVEWMATSAARRSSSMRSVKPHTWTLDVAP